MGAPVTQLWKRHFIFSSSCDIATPSLELNISSATLVVSSWEIPSSAPTNPMAFLTTGTTTLSCRTSLGVYRLSPKAFRFTLDQSSAIWYTLKTSRSEEHTSELQ